MILPIILSIFLLVFPWPVVEQSEEVTVDHKENSRGHYTFVVTNNRSAPYQLSIRFTELVNMKADAELPVEVVLPPGMRDYNLFHIDAMGSPYTFNYSYKIHLGDPRTARQDETVRYAFPFEGGTGHMLLQGYNGTFSHRNTYALDFQMPEGTLVCASRPGVVVALKNDGRRGGVSKTYEQDANHITVYHADGTFAEYVHLKYLGVLVQIGDSVKTGMPIGLSGNTGYSSQPHLHFAVYLPKYFGADTIPIRLTGGIGESLREGETYVAVKGSGN